MDLWQAPTVDVRPQLTEEREDLLALLSDITDTEWLAPTAAPGWTVKDIALLLLDDDLGWLSRGRDQDASGLLDPSDYASFVDALAAKNQRWVDGAQGLSRQVVAGLLAWSGVEMDAHYATMDLRGEGGVVWASEAPVPNWFDIAQDLTERWVHQQQMREAIGRVRDYAERFLPLVLRTFIWAVPHQYSPSAPIGTTVEVTIAGVGTWFLVARNGEDRWDLEEGSARHPDASIRLTADVAWRSFTGGSFDPGVIESTGSDDLLRPLLGIRGIIV